MSRNISPEGAFARKAFPEKTPHNARRTVNRVGGMEKLKSMTPEACKVLSIDTKTGEKKLKDSLDCPFCEGLLMFVCRNGDGYNYCCSKCETEFASRRPL